MELRIEGMTCANCVRHVESALQGVDGVEAAKVNLASETATVQGVAVMEDLRAAVRHAGYRVVDPGADARDEARFRWRQFVFAAVFTTPIFVYTMLWGMLGGAMVPGDGWWLLALATPVQIVAGAPFYRGAWNALRNRDATMDTLVAMGSSAAYLLSTWILFNGGGAHDTYFETGAVIITLISLGKFLEARAKRSSQEAVQSLLSIGAQTAHRMGPDGIEEISADDVVLGDRLQVRRGDKVPVDGSVVEGEARLDESMITGESRQVTRVVGDPVIGATIASSSFVMEATAIGGDTVLSQIIRLVQEANARTAPLQRLADRVSRFFVPGVLLLAAATLLFWGALGYTFWPGDVSRWIFALLAAVAVLVIACPCAMGLATPTAIMMGTGLGARAGILYKGGESLERIAKVDTIVLDKTGTVTVGRPTVVETAYFGPEAEEFAIALAAAVASASEHPVSKAIVAEAHRRGIEGLPIARDVVETDGAGIEATVDGVRVAVGNRRMMAGHGVSGIDGDGVLVALDGHLALRMRVEDAPREDAAGAIARWKGAGWRVVLLTGDQPGPAQAVAQAVGIDEVRSEVRPGDKADVVRGLQAEGRIVAMIGDGINDAPALAQADVGIAMGSGTDVAKETGDIVLMRSELLLADDAIRLGSATVRKIRQNLGWALGYNVALIPLAAGILYPLTGWLLSPMLAAAAMALSSVSVIGNSLLLRTAIR